MILVVFMSSIRALAYNICTYSLISLQHNYYYYMGYARLFKVQFFLQISINVLPHFVTAETIAIHLISVDAELDINRTLMEKLVEVR